MNSDESGSDCDTASIDEARVEEIYIVIQRRVTIRFSDLQITIYYKEIIICAKLQEAGSNP